MLGGGGRGVGSPSFASVLPRGGGAESPWWAPFLPPCLPSLTLGASVPRRSYALHSPRPPADCPTKGSPAWTVQSARPMSRLPALLLPPADCPPLVAHRPGRPVVLSAFIPSLFCPPPTASLVVSSAGMARCSLLVLLLRRPPGPRHPPPWRCSVVFSLVCLYCVFVFLFWSLLLKR